MSSADGGVERVLASWDNVGDGTVYQETLPSSPPSDMMRQEARSFLPGLACKPYWEIEGQGFEWAKRLRSKGGVIKREFLKVVAEEKKVRFNRLCFLGI